MKILALDFGSARTGVAVSDPTGTVVRPVAIVERAATDAGFAKLLTVIAEEAPAEVVVGLPLTLRGEHGAQAQETAVFVDRLRAAIDAPVETYDDKATVSFADFVGQKDTYALRVRGNSMIEDHICEGDMILVENSHEARDGDIVVALVGGTETTLKRFYREPGDMVRLQPANATMSPIRVPAQQIQIQGRLLAVLRKY